MLKKNCKNIMIFLLLFLILTFLIYMITLGEGVIHADEINGVLLGEDIFINKNFLMKDWNLTTGITTFQLLFSTVLCFLFGYSYSTFYIISALNYVLLIMLILYVVKKSAIKQTQNLKFILFIILSLILFPRSHSILNATTHTLVYAACATVLYIKYVLYKRLTNISIWIFISIGVSFFAAFNAVTIYYAILPILLVGLLGIAYKWGNKKQNYVYILFSIFEMILSKIIFKIWSMLRKEEIDSIKEVFVSKDKILENIVQIISNIFYEFGIDIWNKKLYSIDAIKGVLGIVIIYFIIKVLLLIIKKKETEYWVLFYSFLLAALINLSAYGLSTIPSYSSSTHLMELFGIFICCAFGIALVNEQSLVEIINNKKHLIYILLILFLLTNCPKLSLQQLPSETNEVTQFLQKLGYTKGFATYWETGPIMIDSDKTITVAPISVDYTNSSDGDGKIGGWRWGTKETWLSQIGNFVVFSKDNAEGIHADKIIEAFGKPTEYKEIGNYGILIYDGGLKLPYTFR